MEIIKRFPQSILGIALIFTGVSHLTTRRLEFQAQVPNQLKEVANFVVLASGVAEILLGVGLLALWRYRIAIGWVTAIFFVAIFWGNITQFVNGTDAFGLDTGAERFVRLLFQPLLVMWALWSTGAWQGRKKKSVVTERDDLEEDTIYG
jgi:uncharacterized membrane protein